MNHKMILAKPYNFLTHSTARIILERRFRDIEDIFDGKVVLDIGGERNPNKNYAKKAQKHIILNKSPETGPNCISDATCMPFQDKTFNAVLCTEVMEHVKDYQRLIDEIHRVLKDEGVFVLSTRFLYRIHGKGGDYFRYTEQSLRYIFKDFRDIEITPMGNRFTVFWDLLFYSASFPLLLINIFSPIVRMIFFWDDKNAPSGYFVKAKK